MTIRSAVRGAVAGAVAAVLFASGAQAATPYERGTVIVKYAPGASSGAIASLGDRLGLGRVVGVVTGAGAKVVRVAGNPVAVAARLNRSAAVLYAEPNYLMHADSIPDDARFGDLYGIHNTGQSGGTADADIDGPEGWDAAGIGSAGGWPSTGGVKVGIVDSGIDAAHEDLAGKRVNCAAVTFGLLGLGLFSDPNPAESRGCADDNGHGSHVAGTIAAKANNGVGVAGVAFNSQLGICKALSSSGSGPVAGVANCVTYLASRGARVISMSVGGPGSTTLRNAVANAYRSGAGALIVASAGNDGDSSLNYPAAYPEVVSVAATNRSDARAPFSNTNADVELTAAGVDVLSVQRGGGYVAFSGTSMSTPHVAGVAALVMGERGLSAGATRDKLTQTADDLGTPGRDTSFGFGRVNLNRALTG